MRGGAYWVVRRVGQGVAQQAGERKTTAGFPPGASQHDAMTLIGLCQIEGQVGRLFQRIESIAWRSIHAGELVIGDRHIRRDALLSTQQLCRVGADPPGSIPIVWNRRLQGDSVSWVGDGTRALQVAQ